MSMQFFQVKFDRAALTVAAILVAGTAAQAQTMKPADGARGEFRGERIFEMLDADGDGMVSLVEMESGQTRMLARLDTDGNGVLSEAELRAPQERRMAKRFARLDANGDGVVDADEFAQRGAKRFARLDTNGDGAVSRDEMRAGAKHRRARE